MSEELLSDQQQEEALRRWWSSNWPWVLGGFLLGISLLGGWQYWQKRQVERSDAAEQLYVNFGAAMTSGDRSKAESLLKELEQQFKGSPYLDQGHLGLATAYVNSGLFEQAAAELKSVADQTQDEVLKPLANVRWARVQIQMGHYDEALLALDVNRAGAFAAQYNEVRGDALLAKGDAAGAQQAYQAALEVSPATAASPLAAGGAASNSMVDEALVRLKLQDVQAAMPVAVPAVASASTSSASSSSQ